MSTGLKVRQNVHVEAGRGVDQTPRELVCEREKQLGFHEFLESRRNSDWNYDTGFYNQQQQTNTR